MERTAPCRRRIRSATSARPAGLVGRAEPGAVVAVEVLVEHQVVLPRRVVLQPLGPPEAGPPAVRADQEDRDEPVLQVGDDGVQRQPVARAGRVLDGQVVAEEAVVALEGADDQVVEREPERAPPVGVAAEHVRRRLGRLVVDRGVDALDVEHVGVVTVVGGQRPQPVRGQELALVEQLGEQLLQALDADHAQQQPLLARLPAHQPGLAELLAARPGRGVRRNPRIAC